MVIENTNGKIIFEKDENTNTTFYTGRKLPIYAAGDTKWYVDEEGIISLKVASEKYGNGKVPPFSITVLNNPTTYYGKEVTNYKTGNETIDNQVKWQIFYADTKNIYLISTDYVPNVTLPSAKVIAADGTITEYALNIIGEYKGFFNKVIKAYKGSEDITDTRMQALNNGYHEYLTTNNTTSINNNMKSVAYLLDTEIWRVFKGNRAEYAIGGPTLEMLLKSYSQKYGVDYTARTTSVKGYQVSKDGGQTWANFYSGMLNTSDTLYVISASDKKASGMWLASPSARNVDYLMYAYYNGNVNGSYYYDADLAFRPIVCLNSDVSLKAVQGGYEIE